MKGMDYCDLPHSSHVFLFFIQQYAWLVGSQYKPMELAKSDWTAIRKSPPWAIDSWGMGKAPLFCFFAHNSF